MASARPLTGSALAGRLRLVIHAHGQADALTRDIHFQHLHLDDITGLDHVARILDELLRQHGDVYQTVLMHADIDKGAKVGDVGDHALQRHAGLQVLEAFHALLELGSLELRARVTAGLVQLAQHVGDGRDAKALVGVARRFQLAQEGGVANQATHITTGISGNALDQRIGFRVHGRGIQRVVAVHDPQEAGGLLEGFLAEAADLEQLSAIAEGAIDIAVINDILGNARVKAGDTGQQRRRGGVQVHPNGVHTVFHHGVQASRQLHL